MSERKNISDPILAGKGESSGAGEPLAGLAAMLTPIKQEGGEEARVAQARVAANPGETFICGWCGDEMSFEDMEAATCCECGGLVIHVGCFKGNKSVTKVTGCKDWSIYMPFLRGTKKKPILGGYAKKDGVACVGCVPQGQPPQSPHGGGGGDSSGSEDDLALGVRVSKTARGAGGPVVFEGDPLECMTRLEMLRNAVGTAGTKPSALCLEHLARQLRTAPLEVRVQAREILGSAGELGEEFDRRPAWGEFGEFLTVEITKLRSL
eukprot:2408761-Rhodomonas_salina.1